MSEPGQPSSLPSKALSVALAAERKKIELGLNPKVEAFRREAEAYEANRRQNAAEAERPTHQLGPDFERSIGRFVSGVATGLPALVLHEAANGANSNVFDSDIEARANAEMNRWADRLLTKGAEVDASLAEGMSPISQYNEAIVGQNMAQDAAEHLALQEERIASGENETWAKARRLGADIGSGAMRTLENPTYLSNQLAGQVPTLLIGPAANAAARATVGARAAAAVANTPARQAAARAGMPLSSARTRLLQEEALESLRSDAAKTYAGVGGMGMEGSALYGGIASEIAQTDTAALVAAYPGFAADLESGMSEDDARRALLRERAGPAVAAMAPAGFLLGRATAGFELDPLMLGSRNTGNALVSAGVRTAGEVVEEAGQEGSSTFASNYFDAQARGDENADLLDGVGTGMGSGGAVGGVFAGGLSAPSLAGSALQDVGTAAQEAGQAVVEKVRTRVADAKAAEQVAVQEQEAQTAATRKERITAVANAVQESLVTEPTPSAAVTELTELTEPLDAEPMLAPEEKAALQGEAPVVNRVEALDRTMASMRELSAAPQDQQDPQRLSDMTLFALKTAHQLRSRMAELDPETDEAKAIQLALLTPELVSIEENVPEILTPAVIEKMTAALGESPDFATPQSQKAAEQVMVIADVAPDLVTSEMARSVAMYQRMAPAKKQQLETVASLAEIREQHAIAYQRIGKADKKTPSIVTEEVTEKGWGEKRPSLSQFQRRIMSAVSRGDLATASRYMRDLQNFAGHYQNKAKAYDKAMSEGLATNPDSKVDVAFRTLDADGKLTNMPSAWLLPSTAGSQNLVKHIFNDANAAVQMYNQLAETYGAELVKTKLNREARAPLNKKLRPVGEPGFVTVTPKKAETTNAPAETVPADAPVARTPDAPEQPSVSKPAAPDAPVDEAPPVDPPTAVEGSVEATVERTTPAEAEPTVDPELAKILAEAQATLAAGRGEEEAVQDTRTLDDAFAMSDEEYLRAVNPTDKALGQEDLDQLVQVDSLDLPESAEPAGTIVDKAGKELELYRDLEGDRYVVEDGEVVAAITRDGNSTLNQVLPKAKGRGIGQAAMTEYLREFPFAPSGGFSTQGAKARLRALNTLRLERRAGQLASVPGFLEVFQPKAGALGLFARVPDTMRTVSKAIKQALRDNVEPLRALYTERDRAIVSLTPTQVTGLDDLINKVVPEVIRQLNTNLLTAINEGKRFDPEEAARLGLSSNFVPQYDKNGKPKGSWLEALVDGKASPTVTQYGARVLEYGRDEEGKPYVRYQPQIAQAMALASVQWALVNLDAPTRLSPEDENTLYPDGMPPRMREIHATMHLAVQPLRTLAGDITRLLGVQGKNDISVTLTDGIPKALALDAMAALHSADIVKIRQIEGTEEVYRKGKPTGVFKTMHFVDLKGAPGFASMQAMQAAVGEQTLVRLLDPEHEDLPTFEPVTNVPLKVAGSDQLLSAKQREQLRKTNAGKRYRNAPLLKFATLMGDRYLQLQGKDVAALEGAHEDHAKSVKGVIDGLDYAMRKINSLNQMLEAYAGDAADDTAMHWSHRIISNGRVMENGFGGQGDKNAREIFSANKVTGDLSSDEGPLAFGYYLTLAQALGEKTDLLKPAAAVARIRERLQNGAYQALLGDIQALLNEEGDVPALAESIQAQMVELGKLDNAKAIHALVTHARLLEARANGTAQAFTTYLGFELDGKTNGPINALMHFGFINKSILPLMRKGGLVVDEAQPRTIADDVADGTYSDLYRDSADEAQNRIAKELTKRPEGSRESNMLRAGLRMLTLAKQVELRPDNTIEITRDMAKAGMVPTVYGSGARGVANQMAHDIRAALVKHLSDAAMGKVPLDPSVVKSAQYMMSQVWIPTEYGQGYWQKITPPNFSGSLTQVKITEQHFTALVDNLLGGQKLNKDEREPLGAAGIMRESIEDLLRPVMTTFKLVIQSNQLQSAVFADAYQKAYETKRAERIAEGVLDPYHALSRADEAAVRESLKEQLPAYPLQMTGDRSKGEGVFAGDKDFNGVFAPKGKPFQINSMVGGMTMDINARRYLNPGVSAAPLMTIGGGDATMMYLLSEMGLMDGTLNVYDGWEVGFDQIASKGMAANNAVLASWQHDLLGPIAKTMSTIKGEDVVARIGATAAGQTVGVWQRTWGRNPESDSEFADRVAGAIDDLAKEMQYRAEVIADNKQELFSQHRISVDHMAGAGNPAHRGYTTAQLQGVAPAAPSEAEPVAGESAELVERLGQDYQDGLATLGHFELQALLATFPFTDKVRKFVVQKIAHLLPDDVQVFIGTPARIAALQDKLFPGEDLGGGRVPGVTYKGTAFLTVASEETLVHELIHLASLHLSQRFFAGAKGLTAAQKDAMRELQKMIEPFLALPARNEAMRSAQLEVRTRLQEGEPALAINEMLAWSLANSQISGQLEATDSPSVLKKVAKTIRAAVRRLLGLPNNAQIDSFLDQMSSNFLRIVRRPRLASTHSALAAFQRLHGPESETHAGHLDATYRSFGLLLSQLQDRVDQGLAPLTAESAQEAALLQADKELARLEDTGFRLTDREALLFRTVQAVLGSDLKLDAAVMTEFDKLYAQAIAQTDERIFLDDPDTTDEALRMVARTQWSALFNSPRGSTDSQGRSTLVSNFVAMALSHEQLRSALAKLAPAKPELKGETFDQRLRNRVTRLFDWLSDRSMGIARLPSQKAQLDHLATRLSTLQTQAAMRALRNNRKSPVDRLEDKFRDGQNWMDGRAEVVANDPRLQGWIRQTVQLGRGLLSNAQAEANAESLQSVANQPKVPQVIVDLVSELTGNTPSTVRLNRLVNLTRHAVSRVRQQLREEAPADVRNFFSKTLSPETWAQLHRTVGQVDLQALSFLGMSRLRDVVTDANQRQQEIAALEQQLGPNRAEYVAEARILAQAIVHRDVAPRYRNASALARLFGQATVPASQARRLEPQLDRLVSLYALEQLGEVERLGLGNLLGAEPEGMERLLNTMRTLVEQEASKTEQRQNFNRWKGYVPASTDPRKQLVLATAKQAESLVKQGFKRVGYYPTDGLDPANDLAYYAVDWIGGQATFNQGALQTVEGTLSGVDALTGQSLDPGVGTLVVNEGVVSSIASRYTSSPNQRLAPIYNSDGDVVAYERVLDPAVVAKYTDGRKDLALSIGIWLGRQEEEKLAEAMNGQVVTALQTRWTEDKAAGRANQFVAINLSKDPVIADTWNTIPRHTQDMLLHAFGDKVMIRRDMIRNAVGYRSASVADAFTGMSTLPEPVKELIVSAAYALPGVDYKTIVAAEKAIQGAVGTAKDWIVVRSGVVAIVNGIANMFQLVASGINPLELPKLIARKVQETETYYRNEQRLNRIRVELTAVKRPDERNKLMLEQRRLLDANARLSIAPLIFAGELPTIAEGVPESEEYTPAGDFMKWVEKKTENLPQGVLTAAKIATISKDTALYQGLNRMIQLGDFTAKAVLYDKWLQDGMDSDTALDRISERFVNYNLNAGRARDYLESMGLLWFWNYKLRVQKIVLATMRENPLRFLLSVTGADLVGSDSLMTSSAPFTHWEYSIGPDQLWRAPEVTLWHQLFR